MPRKKAEVKKVEVTKEEIEEVGLEEVETPKLEITEFEGKKVIAIVGEREVEGKKFTVVKCEDGATYDVPLTK